MKIVKTIATGQLEGKELIQNKLNVIMFSLISLYNSIAPNNHRKGFTVKLA